MYHLHLKDQPPTDGPSFDSREAAFEHQKQQGWQASHVITFVPDEGQATAWMEREREKLTSGRVIPVPWDLHEPVWSHHDWITGETTYPRFPHMSTKRPGQIAFTPSIEHGIQDRQLITRPGKYLETYFPNWDRETRETYVARCNKEKVTLQIARTADECEAAYVNSYPHITSCMGGTCQQRRGDYSWGRCSQHPVRAYGDSDLGVAYLGDLNGRVTARCVVWPAKQIWTRCYGDTTLIALLEANGYRKDGLHGARIRAIEEGDGYLLPYIDGASYCSLSDDGKWLELATCGAHDWCCQDTTGCTDGPEGYTCEVCGDVIAAGDECSYAGHYYCDSCYNDRYADCANCGTTANQEDMVYCGSRIEGQYDDESWYCDSCSTTCSACNYYFAPSAFRLIQRRDRVRRHVTDHLCGQCDDGNVIWCLECDQSYTPVGTRGCTHCNGDEDEQEEAEQEVQRPTGEIDSASSALSVLEGLGQLARNDEPIF